MQRSLRFHTAPPPTDEELERVLKRVVRGITRVIERRGLGDEPDPLAEAIRSWRSYLPLRSRAGPRRAPAPVSASCVSDTVSISRPTGVAHPKRPRGSLAPAASACMRVSLSPPIEPLELIDRLAALVPPPRFHTVRYHGVLASRSKYRAEVVPNETESVCRPSHAAGTCVLPRDGAVHPPTSRRGGSHRVQTRLPIAGSDSRQPPRSLNAAPSTPARSSRDG